MDDLATIIFSSGSTGEPKGVMLSHFSIDANAQGATQVLHLYRHERVLGILPFFHSFGYLVFWFVMFNNAGLVFHPSPLDVGRDRRTGAPHRVTFLVTTPTFLQLYQRRCTPEQFSSLRVVLTGAEKLSLRALPGIQGSVRHRTDRGLWRHGMCAGHRGQLSGLPRRGYYPTGLAARNSRSTAARRLRQHRRSGQFCSAASRTPGMLLVKGPNVMTGYLGRDDLTASVMRDGWYITGDIATLDDDGFLTITDRLSRFSKIGGEMVPHGRVEEALHQAAESEVPVFAVTGIPDERKGRAARCPAHPR